jgi:uncharacterized oxidoreductase
MKMTGMATTANLAFVPKAIYPSYCATKAFLHSWLQSLRYRLCDVAVEVLELTPAYMRTELPGLLESRDHPGGEVLVECARDKRQAECNGRYDAVFPTINPA